mmetsp:Transcript_6870/g.20567  ORF Transcript_6870/g.20567 Transcript_6870/m.20567 type:complete len:662 (-) Transcript_6870:1391-3376(-)
MLAVLLQVRARTLRETKAVEHTYDNGQLDALDEVMSQSSRSGQSRHQPHKVTPHSSVSSSGASSHSRYSTHDSLGPPSMPATKAQQYGSDRSHYSHASNRVDGNSRTPQHSNRQYDDRYGGPQPHHPQQFMAPAANSIHGASPSSAAMGGRGRGRGRKHLPHVNDVLGHAPPPSHGSTHGHHYGYEQGGYGGDANGGGAPLRRVPNSVPPDDRSVHTDSRSVASRRPLHDMSNRGQFEAPHGQATPSHHRRPEVPNAQYTNYGAPAHQSHDAQSTRANYRTAEPLSSGAGYQHSHGGELKSGESGKLAILKGRMHARLRRRRESLGLAPPPGPDPAYHDEQPPPEECMAMPTSAEEGEGAPPPRYIHVREEEDGEGQEHHQSPLTHASAFPPEGGYAPEPHRGMHPGGPPAPHARSPGQYQGGGGVGDGDYRTESAAPHPASTPRRHQRHGGNGGGGGRSKFSSPHVVESSAVLHADPIPYEQQEMVGGGPNSPQSHHRQRQHQDHPADRGNEPAAVDRSVNRSASRDDEPMAPAAGMGAGGGAKEEYIEIETIRCDSCGRSFGRPAYEKHLLFYLHQTNATQHQARIKNNNHLSREEQKVVIAGRKKVVSELRAKTNGAAKPKKSNDKWRRESDTFREAMRANRLMAKAQKEGKPVDYYL